MIKKALPFLLITILFLITSCTSAAPQNDYASGMAPTLEQLKKWQTVNTDFEGLLTDPEQSSTGVPRIQMLELYNLATEYKISRDDYVSMGFQPLDFLVGDAHKIAQEGHSLLDTLSAVTPVQETESAHQGIVKCIQARVAFAEAMESGLKELGPIDLKLYDNSSDCSTFDADLEKLNTYVNANQ